MTATREAPPAATPAPADLAQATRWRRIAFALFATLLAFRAWFATTLPLSGDEAYHWEWSRHLALGYHDHPGLTAWLIALSTALFGASTEFTVRLPALLCLAGAWLVARAFTIEVVRARGGSAAAAERAGALAMVLVMFAPVTAVLSMYISTDPPLMLAWLLALWLGWRALGHGRWRDWLGAGLALGLALETKFLALLLGPPALLYLVTRWRELRLPPARVAGAALVTGLVLVPLLVWNAQHDWATFRFNFVSRQEKNAGSWLHPLSLVASQLAVVSPVLVLGVVVALAGAWRQRRAGHAHAGWFLFCFTAVPLVCFVVLSLRRGVGFHWPAVAWLAGIVTFAAAAADAGFARRWLVRWSVGIALAMTLGLHVVAHLPQRFLERDVAWFSNKERLRLRAFAERYGWEELGTHVGTLRDRLQAETGQAPFLAATQYGVAASLAFYTPGQPRAHLWSEPRAHGDNYEFWDDYGALTGRDAIIVVKRDLKEALPMVHARFAEVEPPLELPIVVHGDVVRSFHIVCARGFDGNRPFPREP